MKKVRLKKSFRRKNSYLWIFANEIQDNLKSYEKGELVEILTNDKRFYGIGYINPNSLIAIRLISHKIENIDKSFIENVLKKAYEFRKTIGYSDYDAYRLFYSEADGLPGLVIDKYKDFICVSVLTAGVEHLKELIFDILIDMFNPKAILERNDSAFRQLEGLESYNRVVYGEYEEMPVIDEEGIKFEVDLLEGQKTGFFLDQRENRLFIRELLRNRKIERALDCFSYSGGWGLNISKSISGETICVDSSKKAIELIKKNAQLNNLNVKANEADVFNFLKDCYLRRERFDCIVLDPPAFIKSKAKLNEGIKGYKEINQRAMKLLNSKGILVTASCSYHMTKEIFLEVLRSASADVGKMFRIIHTGFQAKDHPVLLSMPETEYLKTIFLERTD